MKELKEKNSQWHQVISILNQFENMEGQDNLENRHINFEIKAIENQIKKMKIENLHPLYEMNESIKKLKLETHKLLNNENFLKKSSVIQKIIKNGV